MRFAVALVLLGGCDFIFTLNGPPEDALPVDAFACPMPVAPNCGVDAPDEDGDDLADACDPCPQFDEDQPDRDNDGIGDACDPDPDVAASCDARRFFGLDTGDGWEPAPGWSFGGSTTNPSDALELLLSSEPHSFGRIETVVRDQPALPGHMANDLVIGLVLMATETGAQHFCAIHPDVQGATGTLVSGTVIGGVETVLAETEQFPVTPGLAHRLQLSIRPDGRLECTSRRIGGSLDDGLALTLARVLPGRFGLVIRGTQSTFEYVDYVPF